MGFQFGIAVGEKTRGRQGFNSLRELLELICFLLGTLLSSTADGVIGEELEQIGLKEKGEKNA
jgi:hypothetical protein